MALEKASASAISRRWSWAPFFVSTPLSTNITAGLKRSLDDATSEAGRADLTHAAAVRALELNAA